MHALPCILKYFRNRTHQHAESAVSQLPVLVPGDPANTRHTNSTANTFVETMEPLQELLQRHRLQLTDLQGAAKTSGLCCRSFLPT